MQRWAQTATLGGINKMSYIAPLPVIPAIDIPWVPLAGGKSVIFNGQLYFTGYQFMPAADDHEDHFRVACRLVSQVEASHAMIDDARRAILKLGH